MLLNRVISFFKYLLICLVLLFLLILGGVNLPFIQRIISEKANRVFIEKKLPIHIDRIKLLITGRIGLSGVRIIKSPGDTAVYVGEIKVSVKMVPLIFHKVKIMGVTIDNATVNIGTDPATGNLDIISIFSSGEKTDTLKKSSGKNWDISIGSVYLSRVRFKMNDTVNGIYIDQTVKELTAVFDMFSIAEKQVFASYISVKGAEGVINLGTSHNTPIEVSRSDEDWKFKLKDSDLDNFHLTFSQPDNKQKMEFDLTRGMLTNAAIDLGKHKINVGKLHLNNPLLKIHSTSTSTGEEKIETEAGNFSFPGPWDISGGDMRITGGSFQSGPYTDDNNLQKADSSFEVTNLNVQFSGVKISSMLSRFSLKDLSFALGNGFRLEDGQLDFNSDSTQKTIFRSKLRSSGSHINLSVEAASGLPELLRSYKSASFSIKIDNTEVSAADLFSFLPGIAENQTLNGQMDFRLALNCDISGNEDLVKITNIDLRTPKGATINVSGDIAGISDPASAKCSLSFNSGTITSLQMKELLSLISSSLRVPDFDPVSVEGSVDSTLKNPQFHIIVDSQSGNMIVDGNIKLNDNSYNLKMRGSHIDLGKFSGINELGIFSGTLDLSGKEFNPGIMKLTASLDIDTIGFKGYNYSRIKVNSNGNKGLFAFNVNSDDPFFKCNLTGSFNLSDTLSGGQVKGFLNLDADRINLYKGFSLSGALEAGLNKRTGGLNGFASLKDLVMKKDNISGSLKDIEISFSSSDSLVKGKVSADFLKAEGFYEGSISDIKRVLSEGKFRGIALIDSAVDNRIPYISLLRNLDVSVEATYDPIIRLFLNDSIFSYNRVSLNIRKDSSDVARADIVVDKFNLGPASGFNATILLERNSKSSDLVFKADSLKYGPVSLTGMSAEILSRNDTATFRIKAGDQLDKPIYNIDGMAFKSNGDIKIISSSGDWVINGFNWSINPRNFLTLIKKEKDIIADLHLKSDQSTIDLYGSISDKISFECRNLALKKILIPGMKAWGYDGEFTGKIGYLGNNKNELEIQMDVRQLKMNDEQLGYMKLAGKYHSDTLGNIETDLNAEMNDTSTLKLMLRYGKNPDQRSLSTAFKGIPLTLAGSLTSTYISDLEGTVGGEIEIKTVNGKPDMAGEIRVSNIGLKLLPVNARFYLPGDIIRIKDNKLLFTKFTVLDSLKNKLDLDGSVDLSDPANIIADLQVTSDHLQVMNTTEKDNQVFNGSVFVNSRISLSGPLQKPSVKGRITLAEGTVINYKFSEDLNVSEAQKTITFAGLTENNLEKTDKKVVAKSLSRTPDIEASIEIDPRSLFNFEISRGFDVGVHITGGGFLTYSMLPGKAIDLTGIYEINKGSSELKITGWPRKDFIITPGSNVKWDGQIDDPELHIETTSRIKGSYINPVDNKNREVSFLVYMKLSGRLSELEIVFDVKSEDQYVTSVFNTLSADERMKQAINLLIFESIQLPNLSSSSDYVTQQINQFWESQLNQITRSAFKKVDVSLGIDTYKGAKEGGGEQTYTSFSYQVKKEMFRDRGSVMVSGRMNDNSAVSSQSNAVFENFIFEYALDSAKTKYLKVYRQQNYEDLLEGEVIKSGVGFIYRKNYDRISDIWRRQKKNRK